MRQRWFSRRAILAHLGLVVFVPLCFLAAWWQATRAMSGNDLSWLYATEWPGIAAFAGYVWWSLVHDDPDTVGARGLARLRRSGHAAGRPLSPEAPPRVVISDAEDPKLAAYNRYLASLAAGGRRKTWRHP